jgi:hypothetical protein
MPNKPITQGYKVFGIADHGYLYNFIWSFREKGLQDIVLQPNLTKTGCLVKSLALSLPRRRLTIYMDNYFTSVPLFSELRAYEFGAVGTTRPHKEFPSEFKILNERFATKLPWNTLLAKVVDNTLCLAWQDNNIVLALSNIHTRLYLLVWIESSPTSFCPLDAHGVQSSACVDVNIWSGNEKRRSCWRGRREDGRKGG